MQLGAELSIERPEREVELRGVGVDVAEGRAVHGEPVERHHAVRGVDHSVLKAGGSACSEHSAGNE